MIGIEDLAEIKPKTPVDSASAAHIDTGVPVSKVVRVSFFSPDEWESFIEEWAQSLEGYDHVRRFSGAGDMGVDVAGFLTDRGWEGGWDNYQCKHYDHVLHPGDAWIEIGKIIYYSFKKEYTIPRKYYFVTPKGVGTTLERYFSNPEELKIQVKANWDKHCKDKITKTAEISLEGDLLAWFDKFPFSIFSSKPLTELLTGHAKTPFHAVKFGGGLPPRPNVETPPENCDTARESRYIEQILSAYGHHLGTPIKDVSELAACAKPQLKDHLLRQRVRFYHAESLRNFARDTVPEGTFENLQEEIYQGVADTCESEHDDGLIRMKETLACASMIELTANPLKSAVKVQDRQGICHQLANEDRLNWVPEEEVSK